MTVEVRELHSEPLGTYLESFPQCSHPVATYLPCIVMSNAALTVHAHETRMIQGKAEHSEN